MIQVAIVGFGKIGQLRFRLLNEHGGFRVVTILEVREDIIFPDGVYRSKSIEEVFEQNVQAVFLCAYNDVLADYTIRALAIGVHVFCEKPPARNMKELQKVVEAYKDGRTILKYGFNHRYHYSILEARRLIDAGDFGKLISIRGVYGKAGSIDYDKNWRNYKKTSGGGILIDQGIHILDLILYLSKDDFSVKYALVKRLFWNIDSEDNVFVLMESNGGTIASIHSSATQWRHKFLLEMTFENGYINLDGILSETRSYSPETLKYGFREFEDVTWAMGKPQEHVVWFENDHSWRLEIEEFYSSIAYGTSINNGTIHDAIRTLSVVDEIYKFVD